MPLFVKKRFVLTVKVTLTEVFQWTNSVHDWCTILLIAHFNSVEQINDICSLIKFVTGFENFPDWEGLR